MFIWIISNSRKQQRLPLPMQPVLIILGGTPIVSHGGVQPFSLHFKVTDQRIGSHWQWKKSGKERSNLPIKTIGIPTGNDQPEAAAFKEIDHLWTQRTEWLKIPATAPEDNAPIPKVDKATPGPATSTKVPEEVDWSRESATIPVASFLLAEGQFSLRDRHKCHWSPARGSHG